MLNDSVLLVKLFSAADESVPPLGLGYLASAIRNKCEVEILDCEKEKIQAENFALWLKNKDFKVIGFHVFTHHLNILREYIKAVKEVIPQAVIIIGGPHPSCAPEHSLKNFPEIDYAFCGEAEKGLSAFLDALFANNLTAAVKATIPGLVWRHNQEVKVNQRLFWENLDDLGMPAWDLLKFESYPTGAPHSVFYKNFPIAPIVTTRGCPFSCTFCAGHLVSGRRMRTRSVQSIIDEIEYLHDNFGVKEINFEDDNFTFNKERVMDFCEKLSKKPWQISFAFANGIRLDSLDEEMLLALKKAGLYEVRVGIESGNNRILKLMQKSLNTTVVQDKIKLIQSVGLDVVGLFIIGYPGETRKEILQTFKFARDLGLIRANFAIFHPFPFTAVTDQLVAEKKINTDIQDWDNFSLTKVAYVPQGFTKNELRNLRRYGFLRFYLRPKILYKLLSSIKSFSHFKFIFRLMFRWVFK
ncbi:MAG: Radical SAM domain protein [Candidatus Magasanikbacteria bacterium GW2011_GWC2_40_17]|uniref:Radical SAM domain protein n=1 Tax=Candidatus Magasanikbacteria bacterium GW2011_GWA2_42_32 TaxID=1619039 RepID=A0A0G1A8M4_9BACT|nr:MAG: Radical SAM domain protein [Candidatus Magasanikbacteria bacterium GW2011_GWC2_40_17]KKS57385.1 MAG: Radical SAM domain protein [Candidatus Magasanikbacteria bacterium GW2011_GWA2_42_32]